MFLAIYQKFSLMTEKINVYLLFILFIFKDVFNSMKRHNVKPNYETFVLFSHLTLFGIHASPQRMVEHFSKILLEMKELGIGRL